MPKKDSRKNNGGSIFIPGTLSLMADSHCSAIVSYEPAKIETVAIKLAKAFTDSFAENVVIVDYNIFDPSPFKGYLRPECTIQTYLSNEIVSLKDIACQITSRVSLISCLKESREQAMNRYLKSMRDLVADLKNNYHYSLMILPPYSQFPGLPSTCTFFDSVIIDLVCGRTRWESARFLKDGIVNAGGRIAGAILSERKFYVPEFIYKNL